MNDMDNVIQDVYNTVQGLAHKVTDIGTQVERIKRVNNFDAKSEAVHNLENERAILKSIESLAAVTAGVVSNLQEEKENNGGFYRAKRMADRLGVMRMSRYNHLLTQLEQHVNDTPCSCGKHKTLQFLSPEGKVIDELCPVVWWVKQSRTAFEGGTLSLFIKETPIGDYTKRFDL